LITCLRNPDQSSLSPIVLHLVAQRALEIAAAHAAVILDVPDHWFDGQASFHPPPLAARRALGFVAMKDVDDRVEGPSRRRFPITLNRPSQSSPVRAYLRLHTGTQRCHNLLMATEGGPVGGRVSDKKGLTASVSFLPCYSCL